MYELAIIGGGPAGVAAVVYAARKRLKTIFITEFFGGQSIDSGDIQNWIGTPSIKGSDFGNNLENHARTYAADSVTFDTGKKAVSVAKNEQEFSISLNDGQTVEAKTVLLATGSKRRKLEVLGAKELENKGITYCASCDGPLFADMDVAVVGGGNAAFETAAQLLAYTKSVTLLTHGNAFRADQVTVDKILSHPKMKAIKNADIVSIKGNPFVSSLTYKDKVASQDITLAVQGIFVEIGLLPSTDIVKGLVELNANNQIVVNPKNQRTSISGVWAAGDCADSLYHQNNIAAGDGVRALEDIYMYLRAGK